VFLFGKAGRPTTFQNRVLWEDAVQALYEQLMSRILTENQSLPAPTKTGAILKSSILPTHSEKLLANQLRFHNKALRGIAYKIEWEASHQS